MSRKEIGEDAIWEIPAERYKTKRPNFIPLSKAALAVIDAQPKIDDCDYIFPSRAKTPFSGFGKSKAALDKAVLAAMKKHAKKGVKVESLPNWTLHDLRRTAKTLMVRAGVRPDISERVLGHVIAGVEGTYDRHSYAEEKRDALEKLAAMIERILNPISSNVAILGEHRSRCAIMSESRKASPNAREKAVEAEIAARENNFKRHKEELLDPLRKVYERSPKAKPFDENNAWRHLSFIAYVYFRREAEISQKQATMPAGDRAKRLRQLGSALRDARRMADEAMKTVRGHWFVEWAEANGNPDFTDPVIERFEEEFDKRVAGLAGLETAAFRAAETVRKKSGRPPGTTVLPHDFIVSLESAYRNITKTKCGSRLWAICSIS